MHDASQLPHIVIVGAGFGGLLAAKGLRGADARITLVDKTNHHLFQPLLYQVATAGLSPADIAYPIRSALRNQKKTEVLMAEVLGVDPKARQVKLADRTLNYDYLILATGARHSYFGRDEWEKYAPGLKSVADATRIRDRVLTSFEMAEMETDPQRRVQRLTFVLVGGGPTGVEMAGAIAELSHRALASDFRHIDPRQTNVVLIEAGNRVLASFPEDLSARAKADLERLGVQVRLNARVENIDEAGVWVGGECLRTPNVIWTAGVIASRAGHWLGAEMDRAGRVKVLPDLTVPGYPEVFVIGDTAHVPGPNGQPLPGVAPVAMQEGRYVAKAIRQRLDGAKENAPFHYLDKGNLATIGRNSAVADIRGIHVAGYFAWLTWLAVHIFYLIGFRNRLLVLIQWSYSYATFQRGARLIVARTAALACGVLRVLTGS